MPLTYLVNPNHADGDLLGSIPTDDTDGLDRTTAESLLPALVKEIDDLQELLYAAGTHSMLVIFQGMDTSGKDGTIRSVFKDVSPLGTQVASFKVPTAAELAHDFLWRIHACTPEKGHIAVFNRSHYEDVLVVRVHELVPEPVWRARYTHINNFEQLLVENNTIIIKFYLHINKKEQKERLLAREKDVTKAWKLAPGDWQERERWREYQRAYNDALRQCTTPAAPWHIVPADKKWARNVGVARAIIAALAPYRDDWMAKLESMGNARRAELATMRKETKA